jgi:hypothetical protein
MYASVLRFWHIEASSANQRSIERLEDLIVLMTSEECRSKAGQSEAFGISIAFRTSAGITISCVLPPADPPACYGPSDSVRARSPIERVSAAIHEVFADVWCRQQAIGIYVEIGER